MKQTYKVYQKGNKYLIVLPDLPQWFIVDKIGKKIALLVFEDKSNQEILGHFPDEKDYSNKTINEIRDIISIPDSQTANINLSNQPLTSRTTVAMVSVTRRCNLKCPHCYVDAAGLRGDELSIKEHKLLAKHLHSLVANNPDISYKVNLTGGEPFLHDDIIKIIEAYKKNSFEITMSTNGLLIGDNHISDVKDMGVALSISLDGATEYTHDFIRGKGTYRKIIKKIAELVNAGVKIGINFLVHEKNLSEMENTVDLAYSLGCNGFNPINLVQLGRACGSNLKRVSEVEIFKRIADHLKANPQQIKMFSSSSLFSSLGAALLSGITCISCGVGDRPCVYITEEGDIFPCPNTQKKEFLLGNIRKQSLAKCIALDSPVLKRLRALNVSNMNSNCSICDVKYFCGGDCRGETYHVTKDLTAPYVACSDRHDSLIELMWIVAANSEFFEERANEYLRNSKAIL